MFDINENLKKLPTCPGVYMHKDRLGNIIYVGKAINLKNRVRQYFQSQKNMAPKVRSMVSQIAEFEYITVATEMEALILECNLIKKHQPKYNILLRDDKTYPYIKVTNEDYPRVIKSRIMKRDGSKYFGPYSDVGAVNSIVELLNSAFELKRCSAKSFPSGFRPCLNYHIKQCKGICTGGVSKEEYGRAVSGAVEFLSGKDRRLIMNLKKKMEEASESLEFEEAATYRDYIEAAKALSVTQRVVLQHSDDADIVLPAGDEYMLVFPVREGKLVGRETYTLDASLSIDEDRGFRVGAFINQHYANVPNVPHEILVGDMPEDAELIAEYLGNVAGHNVKIIKPERGEKRALLQLASKDVIEVVKTVKERAEAAEDRKQRLGNDIWTVLKAMGEDVGDHYDGRQFRAEAYDISNTNGVDTVGAMVVFDGLKADKRSYRKFKIRTVDGQDDYASMREMLSRRFMRVFNGDEGFSLLPDIIFMDGGKGHISTALEVVDETDFCIPVVGMVKDDHHRTRALIYRKPTVDGFEYCEIPMGDKPFLLSYIGRMQEEVHRFAIEYHRNLRGKNVQKSVLDDIKGIGAVRRNQLLQKFGSIENIKKATLEELASAPGMDMRAARNVVEFFKS